MARGRSTKIISMIKWIRTSGLSIKISLSLLVQVCSLKGHRGDVTSVAFTPDGRHVLSGSRDKLVKVWDVETGAEVRSDPGSCVGPLRYCLS